MIRIIKKLKLVNKFKFNKYSSYQGFFRDIMNDIGAPQNINSKIGSKIFRKMEEINQEYDKIKDKNIFTVLDFNRNLDLFNEALDNLVTYQKVLPNPVATDVIKDSHHIKRGIDKVSSQIREIIAEKVAPFSLKFNYDDVDKVPVLINYKIKDKKFIINKTSLDLMNKVIKNYLLNYNYDKEMMAVAKTLSTTNVDLDDFLQSFHKISDPTRICDYINKIDIWTCAYKFLLSEYQEFVKYREVDNNEKLIIAKKQKIKDTTVAGGYLVVAFFVLITLLDFCIKIMYDDC